MITHRDIGDSVGSTGVLRHAHRDEAGDDDACQRIKKEKRERENKHDES